MSVSHRLIGPHVSFFAFRDILVAVRLSDGLEGFKTPSFTKDEATTNDALEKGVDGGRNNPKKAGAQATKKLRVDARHVLRPPRLAFGGCVFLLE